MNLIISNYRAIKSANININSIALIAAANEGGKTSAAQAFAATLTGHVVPIDGVAKKSAGVLVHTGTSAGSAELTTDAGQSIVKWPAASVKTSGKPPVSSLFVAGIQSIVNMTAADRSKTLIEYLKATPTLDDLKAALPDLSATAIGKVWERIQKDGWDGAVKHYENTSAETKGQWLQITSESYGSKKAESWLPSGFTHDLESAAETTLAAMVTDARDSLEAALKCEAVDDSKQAELADLAALLPARKIDLLAAENATVDPALQNQLKECEGFVIELQAKKTALEVDRDALPKPDGPGKGMSCPTCKAELSLHNGELAVRVRLTGEENQSRKDAINDLQKKIAGLDQSIMHPHEMNSVRLRGQIADAETARKQKIAEYKRLVDESEDAARVPVQSGPVGAPVEDCRKSLALAETRLAAFKKKHDADKLHASVCTLEALISNISSTGVRADVLSKALGRFNESMTGLSSAAGWRPVELGNDFMPMFGGTEYLLLSESAKFRVRVILQIALAKIDGSSALVVDAADILDGPGRNGLFKLIRAVGMPAMVCMTINSKDLVPNLAKNGMGLSYWIEGGEVKGI